MTKHIINPEPDGGSATRNSSRDLFQQNAGLVCRVSAAGNGNNIHVEIGPDILGAKPTVTATATPEGFDGKAPSVGAPWRAVADGKNVNGAGEVVVDPVNKQCIVDGKVAPILHDRSLAGPIPVLKQ